MKNSAKTTTSVSTFNPTSISVSNVKWWDAKSANFNLVLDDVITIYGMRYYDAGKGGFISFPQTKDKNGKYWNIVYIPLSEEVRAKIVEAVESNG